METHAKLQKLIAELIEAKREYYRLAFDTESKQKLGPPCSPAQIAKLERILGKPVPPSYRAFLELHNGWEKFDGDTKLLAVEDHEQPWVKERLKTLRSLLKEYGDDDPFEHGAVPVQLGKDDRAFTLLDPRVTRKNGEMDVVQYDLTQEEDRFKDFVAFLKDDLEVTRELIDEEKNGVSDEDDEDED